MPELNFYILDNPALNIGSTDSDFSILTLLIDRNKRIFNDFDKDMIQFFSSQDSSYVTRNRQTT